MPVKELLENYGLYQKYKIQIPPDLTIFVRAFHKPSVHLNCEICESEQTFVMRNDYYNITIHLGNQESSGKILYLDYVCAGCHTFQRVFLIKVSKNLDYFIKVGQYPEPDISIDKTLSDRLGDHKKLFQKGLICEKQGYGIAAYAYYRRIVELIIDGLLKDISDLIDESGKEEYKKALEEIKNTRITEEKIKLVKDLIPISLRPGGLNPLQALHELLSAGLHGLSDEECIEIATDIRKVLVNLVMQVNQSKQAAKELTESMTRILEKKSKK